MYFCTLKLNTKYFLTQTKAREFIDFKFFHRRNGKEKVSSGDKIMLNSDREVLCRQMVLKCACCNDSGQLILMKV